MARTIILLLLVMFGSLAMAGELRTSVNDHRGKPVSEAVVYARPVGQAAQVQPGPTVVIDQVDKEFVPALTVLAQGTAVSFPNNDNIRHHVYSFSKSNAFEIPLYADQSAPPVTFANPGVVALGCNVHDWMSAYVFVSDTPWFGVTDEAGAVTLSGLPAGDYEVEVWQAGLRGKPEQHRQLISIGDTAATATFSIRLKKVWKAWRDPNELEEDY
jgi:plastocyanin